MNRIKSIQDKYSRGKEEKGEGNKAQEILAINHHICKYYLKTTDKETL